MRTRAVRTAALVAFVVAWAGGCDACDDIKRDDDGLRYAQDDAGVRCYRWVGSDKISCVRVTP